MREKAQHATAGERGGPQAVAGRSLLRGERRQAESRRLGSFCAQRLPSRLARGSERRCRPD